MDIKETAEVLNKKFGLINNAMWIYTFCSLIYSSLVIIISCIVGGFAMMAFVLPVTFLGVLAVASTAFVGIVGISILIIVHKKIPKTFGIFYLICNISIILPILEVVLECTIKISNNFNIAGYLFIAELAMTVIFFIASIVRIYNIVNKK